MPSLLSKFTKGPNGKSDTDSLRSSLPGSQHSSQRPRPSFESPSNPRLVLTSESNESLERRPPSPGSMHRADSLTFNAQQRQNNPLYPDDEDSRARRAFAERMKEGNRRALSLGTQPESNETDDLTPGPRRPTRDLPELPLIQTKPALGPPERPSSRKSSRSRRGSAASIEKSAPALVDSPPAMQTTFSQQSLVSSPASEDGQFALSTSPTQKKSWRRRGSQSSQKSSKPQRGAHPSGGLASALAGSGLALAHPAMQRPLVPPVPPIPPRSRLNSTHSEAPPLPHRRDRHAHTASTRKPNASQPSTPGRVLNDNDIGAESGSLGSDDDEDSSPDELDLTEGAAPITGFAVASNKRTADFHALFPTVPDGDYLIDDYGCALQREILIQGRLYISENHICFHANIFGWTTDLVIPIEDISHIDKRMTAYVIPNAIQVSTRSGKYTFASLLSRDTTYDVIFNIWRSVRPEGSMSGSPRGSLDGAGQTTSFGSVVESTLPPYAEKPGKTRKATQCACSKEGKHYSETALETVVPGDPEMIYNLMFASGFIKEFMRKDEKLIDIQISDWAPISEGSKMLTRNMSYIKPLTGGLGPKQTKCELKDEMVYLDYNDYITMLTTTRTPDVPSGNVFSVKTRTCLTWASSVSSRIVVTTQVEWTGRSFIKGIIERSCIDGQKTYHANLERAMRAYISTHKTEFVPEGEDGEADEVVAAALAGTSSPTSGGAAMSFEDIRKAKEKERSQRGLQWALDTVEGTAKVAQQSFSGAIELIKDTWESSSTTAVLWFVVVGLLLSNVWTYFRAGRLEAAARRRSVPRREEDIQRVVGESVRDAFRVFEEVVRGDGRSIVEEVADVKRTLEDVDARVKKVEEQLGKLD